MTAVLHKVGEIDLVSREAYTSGIFPLAMRKLGLDGNALAFLFGSLAPRPATAASAARVVGPFPVDGVIQEGFVDAPPHPKRTVSFAVFFFDIRVAAIRVRICPDFPA